MLCGYNDWDEALDESYWAAVARGEIKLLPPAPPATLEDYGRSITFTLDEIMEGTPWSPFSD